MSTTAFQLFCVTAYLYQFGSVPTCLREAFLGLDPNGIIFKSDPVWVRIADPKGSDPSGPVETHSTVWVRIHWIPSRVKRA